MKEPLSDHRVIECRTNIDAIFQDNTLSPEETRVYLEDIIGHAEMYLTLLPDAEDDKHWNPQR